MPNSILNRWISRVAAAMLAVGTIDSLSHAQQAGPGGPPAGGQVAPIQSTGHPLEPALAVAHKGLKNIEENIKDYTCTLVKRERINGTLTEHEYMFTKVRHQPFSVYMFFLKPEEIAGREVIYVAGQNDGNLIGHEGKGLASLVGAVPLKPTAPMAMKGNRYPITEVGVKNLTKRLIEVAENDMRYGECEVKFVPNAKVNGRVCTCIQVMHPVPRKNFLFHLARVYIDDEMNLPIRYEAYDWPKEPGGQPLLTEEYTYVNLKTNVGLTDADFDSHNPKYKFYKR